MIRYATASTELFWRDDAKTSERRAEAVISSARAAERSQSDRAQRIVRAGELYDPHVPLRIGTAATALRTNIIAPYVDTWVSHICAARPRPMWIPMDGTHDDHMRAKLLLAWSDHLFQAAEVYRHAHGAARDACVSGLGVLRPFRPRVGAPIELERIHPIHVVMDDAVGVGLPDELYIRRPIARTKLRALYPEHEK